MWNIQRLTVLLGLTTAVQSQLEAVDITPSQLYDDETFEVINVDDEDFLQDDTTVKRSCDPKPNGSPLLHANFEADTKLSIAVIEKLQQEPFAGISRIAQSAACTGEAEDSVSTRFRNLPPMLQNTRSTCSNEFISKKSPTVRFVVIGGNNEVAEPMRYISGLYSTIFRQVPQRFTCESSFST